jgi:DNA-directed RNA polymerase subunit RPC12/RpoP
MDITFNCQTCGQNIVIDEAGIGQIVDCPKCGKQLEVPYKSLSVQATPAPKPATPALLANCPDCGREISERAITCPFCGAPIVAVRNKMYRRTIAGLVLLVGLIILGYECVRLKSIGDEVYDKVGLGNNDAFASWYAAMGFRDFSGDIILPTRHLADAENENFERQKWNLRNPDEKKPEISIDHLKDEYKQKVEDDLAHLYGIGRETATHIGIFAVVILMVAAVILPKRN